MTYGPSFQFPAGYVHDPYTCKNQGQRLVGSKARVEKQTNGRTRPIAVLCPTRSVVTVESSELNW